MIIFFIYLETKNYKSEINNYKYLKNNYKIFDTKIVVSNELSALSSIKKEKF